METAVCRNHVLQQIIWLAVSSTTTLAYPSMVPSETFDRVPGPWNTDAAGRIASHDSSSRSSRRKSHHCEVVAT